MERNASCSPSQGNSRFYVISLYDATAVVNFDTNPGNDRYTSLETGGMIEVTTISKDGHDVTIVGTEIIDDSDASNDFCAEQPNLCRPVDESCKTLNPKPDRCRCELNPNLCYKGLERRQWQEF